MTTRLLLLAAFFSCRPADSSNPPEPEAESSDAQEVSPLEPDTPTNREAGERFDAIVPLFGGGTQDLADLRGKVVLVELSASGEDGWTELHEAYESLAARHGEDLAIVVVANDEEGRALEELATRAFVLGWDPQGALATRLRLASFPTYIVLDRNGEIQRIERDYDEKTQATLEAEIERLRATPPAK